LVVPPPALIEKDQSFEMIRHHLQRLHGAQLGQIEIALLERGLALAHQRIDGTRIDALRLAGTGLPWRRRIGSRWCILLGQADRSFGRLSHTTLAKAAATFNAQPISQKKTAGAKSTRRSEPPPNSQ
jgi:hypothetical protein